jgi:large subunit ribosomal protein L25
MERVKLEVRRREGRGTKDAKALRAAGEIPGVIYSSTHPTEAIAVNARALRSAVAGPSGIHTILDVTVDGTKKPVPALIKDLQLDPVRDSVMHIDLHEIRLDQKITTALQVHVVGLAAGVNMGGSLTQPTHEVAIEVLPTAIPEAITIDVSDLEIGQSIRLGDIEPPEGVTFLDDPESTMLVTVVAPIAEEELEVEGEEGEELEEGEEAAEEGAAEEGAAEEAGSEE